MAPHGDICNCPACFGSTGSHGLWNLLRPVRESYFCHFLGHPIFLISWDKFALAVKILWYYAIVFCNQVCIYTFETFRIPLLILRTNFLSWLIINVIPLWEPAIKLSSSFCYMFDWHAKSPNWKFHLVNLKKSSGFMLSPNDIIINSAPSDVCIVCNKEGE